MGARMPTYPCRWCKLTGNNLALRSVQGAYATKSLRRKEVGSLGKERVLLLVVRVCVSVSFSSLVFVQVFVSNTLGNIAVTVDQYRGVMLPVTYFIEVKQRHAHSHAVPTHSRYLAIHRLTLCPCQMDLSFLYTPNALSNHVSPIHPL